MAEMPAAISAQIAEKAGLDERYVREWLGAMTVGNIVENDPAGKTYYLPPEHAAGLCRKAPTDNIAVFAQYIPLLGSVEDDIVHCFRNGGGVPYERFERFHEGLWPRTVVSLLFLPWKQIFSRSYQALSNVWNEVFGSSTSVVAGGGH